VPQANGVGPRRKQASSRTLEPSETAFNGPLARRLLLNRIAGSNAQPATAEEAKMLWTIVVILAVLWLLGMVGSYTFGGLIHILLVVALIIVVVNLLQGRRAI
jgi:hypothetical protein